MPRTSVLDAERLTLSQVARRLDLHTSTIWRWVSKGVNGRRLSTILIGGRRHVLLEDLEKFLNRGRDREHFGEQVFHARAQDAGNELTELGM